MSEIDPITGLPKELAVWENLVKESQKIIVTIEKRKYGKKYTIVSGFDKTQIDITDVAKKLKNELACGGTAKDNQVELQGDHMKKIKQALIKLGFAPESIELRQGKFR